MRHFGIELVVKRLPEKIHHKIEPIIPVIIGIVALTMITEGIKLIGFNKNRIYASMNLTYTWTYLAIPVSGCLMIFYLLWHEIRRWRAKQEGGHHS